MDSLKYLEQRSKEYQNHLASRNKLEKAIKFHQQIKITREIPRQFKPKVLNPISRAISLQEEFNKEYNELFFKHLDKVITQNQVSREIEEGALRAIISQTAQELTQLDKPLEEVQHLYYTFTTSQKKQSQQKLKPNFSCSTTRKDAQLHHVTPDTPIPSPRETKNENVHHNPRPQRNKSLIF